MKKLLLLIMLIPFQVNAFNSSAVATVLMDTDSNRVLYSKNPHYVQSVASISKVMTAIIVLENTNIKKEITIGDEILKAYGSGIYIKQGEKLTIEDLLYGLMLRSGNDAAIALAYHTTGSVKKFVKLMNKKAKQLNMSDTTFNNPSGLDEEKGNYSSAYDMALLMSYAMKNEDFKTITKTKVYKLKTNKNTYQWHNKNKLLTKYKYTTGGKTGFTKKAKRTLITTSTKDNLNLTVVTLNDGNDWEDHIKLYEEAYQKYKAYNIVKKGNISILGENYYNNDNLYIKNNIKYPLLENEKEAINLKFELTKKRNYKNKEKVGKVKVYIGDKQIKEEKIYVKKDDK